MALAEADRAAVIEKHRLHTSDTGSADVQVALLTPHQRAGRAFADHKHDNHSRSRVAQDGRHNADAS